MLYKLQKKTINPVQIIGYAITLTVGVSIILILFHLYFDLKGLFNKQTDVFNDNAVVISKEVSAFKSLNKNKIYFTDKEIANLKKQPFVKNVSYFNFATFKINAFTNGRKDIPKFYTDLFFESVPNNYLDFTNKQWTWESTKKFIPIIIPENYLKLYNFGFAESQGLPVLSKNTISEIDFNVQISGNGNTAIYSSKIVGFSNKINSILVPDDFLKWANKKYGHGNKQKVSRLLLEFSNPNDTAILAFFNDHNYAINKDKLEFSKLLFFFKSLFLFILIIAIIIVLLAIAFVLLSINLIFQKNKKMIVNLSHIGYTTKQIAKFYKLVMFSTTIIAVFIALIISYLVRNLYLQKLKDLFEMENSSSFTVYLALIILVSILVIYHFLLNRKVAKITKL
ncbi:MAG: FtsX-like permease family protein [Flavobacteriaceae bacterium]